MYGMNGKRLSRKRTKRAVRWSNAVKVLWTKLLELRRYGKHACALMLVGLLILLAGCATTSTPPETMPRNPTPPPSRLPDSPPNYLTDAQSLISEWQKLLKELMAKPAN